MVTLAAEALHVGIGGTPILHGIDCALQPGALTGIIGPNGAGKSTLLRALMHLLPASAGRVLIDGQPGDSIDDRLRARLIAYLPQGQTVHWPLSVERLVALGRLPHLAPFSRLADKDHQAVRQAMADADVLHLADRAATELSGGERSRVLLARALSVEAPVLIVDEPLAALDPGHQLATMALLKGLANDGRLVVVVMHDLTMASRFCDRLLLLSEGRLVADGQAAQVLGDDNLRRVYGIEALTGEHQGQRYVLPWRGIP